MSTPTSTRGTQRRKPQLPSFNAEEAWGLIKVGVQKNLDTKRGEKPMETEEYMRCYTAVHEFCTTHKAVIPISAASRNKKGDAHLLGEDLYNALKEHLFEHVQSIRGKLENYTGDELLKEYIEEWTQFKDGAQRNARMLTYLNRHWVVRVLDEGNQEGAHEILPLHTVLWEEVVLDVSQDIVREELLRLVERRRKGDSVDEKIVGDLLAASPVDEKDSTKRVPDVYQLLLQTTPDHNTDTTDQAILFRATQLGYVPTVSYLLGLGLKVDIEDATGRTSLSHAAQSQYIGLLKFLLSHSASPNAQDKEGLAPLHWASKFSDHPHHYSTSKAKAIKVLLEHGADPMLKDRRGKTALAWAKQAQSDNTGALFLLKRAMEGKGISGMDNEEKITT